MYQLVSSAAPAQVAENDRFNSHDFLAAWLRHHAFLEAGQELLPDLRLVEDLDLDGLNRLAMVGDVELYYNVMIPDAEIGRLATVRDVETCLHYQLAKVAA